MITFDNGGALIQSADELPPIPDKISRLYADFETSSGDDKLMATDPWRNCTAIGIAVAFDDSPASFVPRSLMTTGWWNDVLRRVDRSGGSWRNHNVKFDMHVSANDLGVMAPQQVLCTLTGAKLIDSDRTVRGGYGLDALVQSWCGIDIAKYWHVMQPYLKKTKDYARVPIDIMAEYACHDVMSNRPLDRYIERMMPEESWYVWNVEQQITHLLWEMERTGLCVDPLQIKVKQFKVLTRMVQIEEQLFKIVGRHINPGSGDDCYDVLCAQYGVPVLAWTTKDDGTQGGPSFDKAALQLYWQHPDSPKEVVELISEYRKLSTFNSLFLCKYEELHIDGVLHPNHNQLVRTGRMSCSDPNTQQLSEMAKELIIPPKGYAILSADASQLEYRLIATYIENKETIDTFNREPWTDYHQFISDRMGTSRRAGKTMNFRLGYGGGRKNAVAAMSIDKAIVGDIIKQVEEQELRPEIKRSTIKLLCEQKGNKIYDEYHRMLPELKPTTIRAADACKRRGYARNWYGRRRHIDPQRAHIAFNTLCQSTAGDYIKERQLALRREVPGLQQITQVHDQVLGIVPLDILGRDPDELPRNVATIMNHACPPPGRPFPIPFRTAVGWSAINWKHAQKDCEKKY